ncbi:hypothetical protein [Lactococcus sp. dk322]|uniref:hypothetical protein n=1 Tax=Lactococcus sp. dk322 TaxID=2603290 RepID=UPI0011C794FB|nr:hypothetical protein [Lactococcus sp. dk322]TXK45944.1 hypothetical protein FVP43_11220 [Lactococcus sp. dk322]
MDPTKKQHWIYFVEIFYILVCYSLLLSSVTNELNYFFSFLPNVLQVVVFISPLFFVIFNWAFVFRRLKKLDGETLLKNALLLKYSLILFFIIGGLIILGVSVVAIIPLPGLFAVGVLPPILTFMGWMILFGAAPFPIAYLIKCYRKGECNLIELVLLIISQFVFSLDVISLMYLTFKVKKYRLITLITLSVLLVCLTLVIFKLIH